MRKKLLERVYQVPSRRRRGHQRMRCLDGITDAMDMNMGKLKEMVKDREAWRAVVHGVTEADMAWQLKSNIAEMIPVGRKGRKTSRESRIVKRYGG